MIEKYLEKLDWRVLAALLFGIGFFMIVFVILTLFSGSKISRTASITPTPQSIPSTPTPYTAKPRIPSGWKTESEQKFEISHPENWKREDAPIADGGRAFLIKPEGEAFPRINIYEYTPHDNAAEHLIRNLERISSKKYRGSFSGKAATIVEFEIKGENFVTGNPLKKDIIKRMYVLEHGEYTYGIDYAYYKETQPQAVEKIMQDILDTFQFR